MAERWRVQVLNAIAPAGLACLPAERFELAPEPVDPQAILLRSADLHARPVPPSVCAIARAGAGTDNIPVAAMTARGVPVFYAPGANANAVKELVIAGLLVAARRVVPALDFVRGLDPAAPDMEAAIERGKKAFAGRELAGATLGVVGLGKVGALVAQAAHGLGMRVLGHDPALPADAALPPGLQRLAALDELLAAADFVTLHVPLLAVTRHLLDAARLARMPAQAVLLNFSRDGVADTAAVLHALDAGRLAGYVCDFPAPGLVGHPKVVALPHLGASTAEAETQCAVMAATQLREYLLHGSVGQAVNFPAAVLARSTPWRVALAHANVPAMLGRIAAALADHGLNIAELLNRSRGDLAYTLVDVESAPPAAALQALRAIAGVRAVRELPA